MTKRNTIGFFSLIIIIFLNLPGCKGDSNRNLIAGKSNNAIESMEPLPKKDAVALEKVIFFIENSGSMFGYVNQANEFKNSLVGLAYLPEFDRADKSFYFINGTSDPNKNSSISINNVGNDPNVLKNNLNPASFNKGDVRFSDLNKMFEIALDSARGNQISILVSDCIYDVGNNKDPLTALNIEIQKTQQAFRFRLDNEDLQTLIIKASSNFDGLYYYASKGGSIKITNEERPFYIVVFGKSELLNKMLTEKSIGSKITSPLETARFFVNDDNDVPYQIVPSIKRIGSFKLDFKDNHKITDANPYQGRFQFTVAVDLSALPFPESYITSISNYNCSSPNYMVTEVEKISKNIPGVAGTHLITISTNKNPLGELEIMLKNVTPSWVMEADITNENQIDHTHTYGFKSLTDAISEAYLTANSKNSGRHPATFKISISK